LRRLKSSTRIDLGANIMNRPHYFRMVSFNTSYAYEFHTSSTALHNITPFKLGYTKMLETTTEFDKTLSENPAIALSFRDQFIPLIGYTFTYDNGYEKERQNRWIYQLGFSEAGNILYGIYSLCGVKGEKEILGNPFSQFVKLTNEVKYFHYFTDKLCLASRLYIGAGYAYGNASELPYSEQFYIGGANSIRAFTIRSIGPGSYRPDASNVNGFFDQTGNFKLEANIELRFPIWGSLEGATFIDAGNIWLLKEDDLRPGGKLSLHSFGREIALGTGLGLRYDIANYLVVRIDVGVPIHAPYDTGHAGYYNIEGSFWKNLRLHLAIGYPF
ncbi:MAG: BamA/TamA family outer membrane protein, partial [Bacteroidaceae bacterium]|nr:BamA/TamA family outer membrane protein [Bacteroidaceae bacterium]